MSRRRDLFRRTVSALAVSVTGALVLASAPAYAEPTASPTPDVTATPNAAPTGSPDFAPTVASKLTVAPPQELNTKLQDLVASGRLTDADGRPIADANLKVFVDGERHLMFDARTDEQGNYRVGVPMDGWRWVGAHILYAEYGGSGTYLPTIATSGFLLQEPQLPTSVTVNSVTGPIRRGVPLTITGRVNLPPDHHADGADVYLNEKEVAEALAFGRVDAAGNFSITYDVPPDAAAKTQPRWELEVVWPGEGPLAPSVVDFTVSFADAPQTPATATPTALPTSADRGLVVDPGTPADPRQVAAGLSPTRDILSILDPWATAFSGSALLTLVGATMISHGRRRSARD